MPRQPRENNIYFEVCHCKLYFVLEPPRFFLDVREVLNQVERESIVTHGYALHSFAHSLFLYFSMPRSRTLTPALHEAINGFAHTISAIRLNFCRGCRRPCNIYPSDIT